MEGFLMEYWAEFDPNISNYADGRWRVCDPYARLSEWQQQRWEGNCNGLLLLSLPLAPDTLQAAELYAEVWGGHNGCANQRFTLNGRAVYGFGNTQTCWDHCAYQYPSVPLDTRHLVRGVNVLQLSVDRGVSFLGNFLLDEACIRAWLPNSHPFIAESGLSAFTAAAASDAKGYELPDRARLSLQCDLSFHDQIDHVDYLGRYVDFNDNGHEDAYAWRGYTYHREQRKRIGISTTPPFDAEWDTTMIPDQDRAIEIKARIVFKSGLQYETPIYARQFLRAGRQSVMLCPATVLPAPFYSRDLKPCEAVTDLSCIALETVESAWLQTRVWDGGEGDVRDYFTLNGVHFPICTGTANHQVYETCFPIPLEVLRQGENTFRLLSDTKHHGIEVLLPGPVIKLRLKG